jgi:hypothetical protein
LKRKKIKINIINFKYFNRTKKIKIFLFFEFYLRIELIFLLKLKPYLEYFRYFKYKEYIILHPNLKNNKNLKKFLLFFINDIYKKNNKKIVDYSLNILYYFKIYGLKIEYSCQLKYLKIINLQNKFLFNKNLFCKFIIFSKINNYTKLFIFLHKNTKIINFYFLYKI